jgi:hypothetical protein
MTGFISALFAVGWLGAAWQFRGIVRRTRRPTTPGRALVAVLSLTLIVVMNLLDGSGHPLIALAMLPLVLELAFEGGVAWARAHASERPVMGLTPSGQHGAAGSVEVR